MASSSDHRYRGRPEASTLSARPGLTELTLNGDRLSWREVDGEILALDLAGSRYLGTNPAGALLWKALAAGATRDALADALVAEFAIDRARAAADVDVFLRDLAAQGLLVA